MRTRPRAKFGRMALPVSRARLHVCSGTSGPVSLAATRLPARASEFCWEFAVPSQGVMRRARKAPCPTGRICVGVMRAGVVLGRSLFAPEPQGGTRAMPSMERAAARAKAALVAAAICAGVAAQPGWFLVRGTREQLRPARARVKMVGVEYARVRHVVVLLATWWSHAGLISRPTRCAGRCPPPSPRQTSRF